VTRPFYGSLRRHRPRHHRH